MTHRIDNMCQYTEVDTGKKSARYLLHMFLHFDKGLADIWLLGYSLRKYRI